MAMLLVLTRRGLSAVAVALLCVAAAAAPAPAPVPVDALVAAVADLCRTRSSNDTMLECDWLILAACDALDDKPSTSASDLVAQASGARTAACALQFSDSGQVRSHACSDAKRARRSKLAAQASKQLRLRCAEIKRSPRRPKASPLAVACRVVKDTGFGGTGPIFGSFHKARSQLARVCPLESRAVRPVFLTLRQGVDLSPRECSRLPAQCAKLVAGVPMPSPRVLKDAVTEDVLAAAITGLETGTVPATEPVALATACAMARSPYLLHDACFESEPKSPCLKFSAHRWCKEAFMEGKTAFQTVVLKDRTGDRTKAWRKINRGVRDTVRETVNKDCCQLLDDDCLCEVRKDVIDAGKVPVGCLNKTKLHTCTPIV